MLSYLFSPLDMHFDKGFGAMADSFQEAASTLKKEYGRHKINGHLPICYLYRHAIELYLKASIIIVHRSLEIPYGDNPHDGQAQLLIGTEWKSLYQEHQIGRLYRYLVDLFSKNMEYLAANTKTKWTFPDDFDSKIKRIQNLDSSSTYFRYPVGKLSPHDKEKSAFKETTVDQVMAGAVEKKKPMKTMMTVDLIGRPKHVFIHDDSFTEEALTQRADVADTLSGCHIGLIHELGGGGVIFTGC